jgi:AraC-like DNA-binding protein
MDDLNRIIESLNSRYVSKKCYTIFSAVCVESFYDSSNVIIRVDNGKIFYGWENDYASQGGILLIPSGKRLRLAFGKSDAPTVSNEEVFGNKSKVSVARDQPLEDGLVNITVIRFDIKIFESVNFLSTLEIPPFSIYNSREINELVAKLTKEDQRKSVGKERMQSILTDQLMIDILRYILDSNLFVEQMAINTSYFKDPRLIDLFTYIKDNLNGDLSNKVLADVANVSEDYVGQYFKFLTGSNPQDYVEYQRMELSLDLLRTSKISIRELAKRVGYKDVAYFCRRFKIVYGIPAAKMRKRDSLMNVVQPEVKPT